MTDETKTDPTHVRCPSGLVVAPTGLKIRQLKLLSDRRSVKSGAVFEEFLRVGAAEIVDRGPYPDSVWDWKRALIGDRFRALIGVRVATHGPSFDFDVRCDVCGEPIKWSLNLLELPVRDYPATTLEAWKSGKPMRLTVGGRAATYRVGTGEEEARMRAGIEKLKDGASTGRRAMQRGPGDDVTDSLFLRLDVEGVEKRDLRDWLDDLDGAELTRITESMDAASGGVETVTMVECQERDCGAKVRVEIPFTAGSYWLPRTTATTTDLGSE